MLGQLFKGGQLPRDLGFVHFAIGGPVILDKNLVQAVAEQCCMGFPFQGRGWPTVTWKTDPCGSYFAEFCQNLLSETSPDKKCSKNL